MVNLLPEKMYNAIEQSVDIKLITEIRVRLNRQLIVKVLEQNIIVKNFANSDYYLCDSSDINHILSVASKHSIYSVEDEIAKGYITYEGGIRIGVVGEGVYVGDKLKTIKNINSLVIRLPHEIIGCSDIIISKIYQNNNINNTLIVSRPGCGKTTILRDICRQISNKYIDTMLIDERNEISGSYKNKLSFDIGKCTDCFTFINKNDAYEKAIRACNPKVIIVDEIFSNDELLPLLNISKCGISIIGSMHIDNTFDLKQSNLIDLISNIFKYIVFLDNIKIGKIDKIIELND